MGSRRVPGVLTALCALEPLGRERHTLSAYRLNPLGVANIINSLFR
jgi:hypothetical protein